MTLHAVGHPDGFTTVFTHEELPEDGQAAEESADVDDVSYSHAADVTSVANACLSELSATVASQMFVSQSEARLRTIWQNETRSSTSGPLKMCVE